MTGIELKPPPPAFSRLILLVKLETFDDVIFMSDALVLLLLLLLLPYSLASIAIPDVDDDVDGRKTKSKTLSSFRLALNACNKFPFSSNGINFIKPS